MKATLLFAAYFLIASLLAAIVTYPIYSVAPIQGYDFERWVTRFALLFLVIGIYPCLKLFKVTREQLGYNYPFIPFLKRLTSGFVIGLVILAFVIAVLLALDVLLIKDNETLTSSLISKALFAGLIVALIEETLFRGLFFKLTLSFHNASLAVFLSSFFYASLHFIKPYSSIDPDSINWFSGLHVIFLSFSGLSELAIDDFLALFAVGILLALVRYKTQSLAYCIGLHASWVLLLKVTNKLTTDNPNSPWHFLTGEYDGIIGYLAFTWLLLLSLLYLLITRDSAKN